jgi:hypothetical protein
MSPKPKRYQDQRCLHFITFSYYQRRQLLDSAAARATFDAVTHPPAKDAGRVGQPL